MSTRCAVVAVLFVFLFACRRDEAAHERVTAKPAVAQLLRIARATASSSHARSYGYTYEAANAVDGSIETSWQPAVTGAGLWLRLELEGTPTVFAISIANGFQTKDALGDEFANNARLATAHVRFDDGTQVPLRFAPDARGFVRFELPPTATHAVELRVDSTQPGSKFPDLAVSEVQLEGVPTAGGSASPRQFRPPT